jgi:hypothetical protein
MSGLVRIADSRQWRKFCRNSIRFHLLHKLATAETNLSFAS